MTQDLDYQNNPLHGLSLKSLLTEIVDYYGFNILFAYLNINCFANNPSIESSVKFRKKPIGRGRRSRRFICTSSRACLALRLNNLNCRRGIASCRRTRSRGSLLS